MEQKYKGTTVNERLYLAGLIDAFDDAVKKEDVEEVVSILKQVELADSNIDAILEFQGLKRKI